MTRSSLLQYQQGSITTKEHCPFDLLNICYLNLHKALTVYNGIISTFELKTKSHARAGKPLEGT